jgi:hypothetical protein
LRQGERMEDRDGKRLTREGVRMKGKKRIGKRMKT